MTDSADPATDTDTGATEPDTGAEVPAYPQHWSADVLASDGRAVRLRPIVPSDGDKLVEFHSRLSERTRYLRYFGPYPTMSARDVRHFTEVDYSRRVALVMELGGEMIAVGSYEGLAAVGDGRSAEVAFVVADDHQGRGLGPILLEHLAGAAAENGLERFVAEVLSENRHMVAVFREAGYQIDRSYEGGVVHLEFAIDPTEALLAVRNARERAAEARSVRNVLTPKSVAVIGASNDPLKVGHAVLTNLLEGGFSGPVYPVNDEHRSVRGVRAYTSVREIPDDVDLAVMAVPATQMDQVLEDCLAKDVKALVIVSSGFSDSGPEGVEQERRLVHAARAHGMRVVGPNALGVANTDGEIGLNSTLAPVLPGRGRIGFFCQSGALGIQILGGAASRRLGLSTFVSAGNRGDVSGNDVLQYWDTDPATDVVLLYLESFGNPRKFSRIARRVARSKPIVAVKSGRHAVVPALGATGMEIDEATVRALFEQSGVIQVDSIAQLFDCAALLAYQPLPAGPRVAVIGNSTALGLLTADAVRSEGLHARDAVDLGAGADAADFQAAIETALADDEVDAVMVVFVPPIALPAEPFAGAIRDAAQTARKPIVTTFLAEEGLSPYLCVSDDNGDPLPGSVPSYPGPERAALSLARVWRYADWLQVPVSQQYRPDDIDNAAATALIGKWGQVDQRRWLTEAEAAELLSAYGIPVMPLAVADGAEAAVAAAEEVGYPVAVRAIDPALRRRPDMTGVRLDLNDAEAVRRAHRDLTAGRDETRVQVQAMAVKGINCVLAVQDDPSFGSVISFGLAGVISSLLGDRAYRVLPVTEAEAEALIDEPKAAPLLRGYGLGDPVDHGALVALVHRISALIEDCPQVRDLVLDPILVAADGATVLEAQVRIGPEPQPWDLDTGPRRLS